MDNRLQVTLEQLAGELSLEVCQVASVVQLLDDENTVPFITRYRKEQTGNLDEVQIREIERRVQFQRQLAEKAANILRLVETQGKLTDELKQQIESATTLKRLDDLYLPFRPKRKSRAQSARQKGLEPLAQLIRNGKVKSIDEAAAEFVDECELEQNNTKQKLKDKKIEAKLSSRENLQQLLTFVVRGAARWYREGLGEIPN